MSSSSMFLYTTESPSGTVEFSSSYINLIDNKELEDHLIKPTWTVPGKSGCLVRDANQGGPLELCYDERSRTLMSGIETEGSISTNHIYYLSSSFISLCLSCLGLS